MVEFGPELAAAGAPANFCRFGPNVDEIDGRLLSDLVERRAMLAKIIQNSPNSAECRQVCPTSHWFCRIQPKSGCVGPPWDETTKRLNRIRHLRSLFVLRRYLGRIRRDLGRRISPITAMRRADRGPTFDQHVGPTWANLTKFGPYSTELGPDLSSILDFDRPVGPHLARVWQHGGDLGRFWTNCVVRTPKFPRES